MEKEDIEHILKKYNKLLDQPQNILETEKQDIVNKYDLLFNQIPKDVKNKMNGVIKIASYVEWYYSPNKALGDKSPYEAPKKEVKCLLTRIEWAIPV